MIYGYINEFGQLTSDDFSQEEALKLNSIWKPVMPVDDSKLVSDDPEYIVKLEPYDAGDKIDYRYIKKIDRTRIRRMNEQLASELASTDYQVIKCYEASLVGAPMPYDVENLIAYRQSIRDRINQNENRLENA